MQLAPREIWLSLFFALPSLASVEIMLLREDLADAGTVFSKIGVDRTVFVAVSLVFLLNLTHLAAESIAFWLLLSLATRITVLVTAMRE